MEHKALGTKHLTTVFKNPLYFLITITQFISTPVSFDMIPIPGPPYIQSNLSNEFAQVCSSKGVGTGAGRRGGGGFGSNLEPHQCEFRSPKFKFAK